MLTFRAMNTDVAVVAANADEPRIAIEVARVFAEAERRFSRFRDDSELAQLNRSRGPIVVSRAMFDALVTARRYVELTDGIFDPAIGGALVALGYDRSFAPGSLDRLSASPFGDAARPGGAGAFDRDSDEPAPRAARFLELELDAQRGTVTRPTDVQIDLGGMIKGRTVDEAAVLLPAAGSINAGGDAVVRGGDGCLVDVEDPRDATRRIATIRLRDGAVATSAANRRRWRVAGAVRHHLVDPRTQRSAATDLLQVTIVAPAAELADVLAKTVFVLGCERGRAFLARWPEVGAILVPAIGPALACGEVEVVS